MLLHRSDKNKLFCSIRNEEHRPRKEEEARRERGGLCAWRQHDDEKAYCVCTYYIRSRVAEVSQFTNGGRESTPPSRSAPTVVRLPPHRNVIYG
ncbi:hypothetical protein EVAR_85653_1 [Eumeta japonica]|uniref:Uncharacterized protein n=1 Tax=Eumeta variegata TaxID=151549 RepID=A0A4C1XRD0_EUMVA|nr:hypothetical protein EVAR_85653_1 [Eumeta japonica]